MVFANKKRTRILPGCVYLFCGGKTDIFRLRFRNLWCHLPSFRSLYSSVYGALPARVVGAGAGDACETTASAPRRMTADSAALSPVICAVR